MYRTILYGYMAFCIHFLGTLSPADTPNREDDSFVPYDEAALLKELNLLLDAHLIKMLSSGTKKKGERKISRAWNARVTNRLYNARA